MSVFVDTNVLLYASGVDDDAAKRDRARRILDTEACVFSVQVFNEFVNQVTQPRRPRRMSVEEAVGIALSLRRFPVIALDMLLFERAAEIRVRTQYNWWDSLIVAAAIIGGCDTLVTEDLQHGRIVDGVRIENPFRELA